jgi:hypothetical protein
LDQRLPRHARPARRPAHADPGRPPADKRRRRSVPPQDPRGVLTPAFARYLQVRFTGLKRDLAQSVDDYNFERIHNGCLTRGRSGEIVTVPAR